MPVQLDPPADEEGDEARIEIIPLIDIMFFLLASFMLVSLSMAHIRRVPVELPATESGSPEQRTPPVTVAIDADGVVYLGHEPIGIGELVARIRGARSADDPTAADPRVMIAADGRARHADVLRVIDALRVGGLAEIGFESREAAP